MNNIETSIYENNILIEKECPICLLEIKLEKEMPCCNNLVCESCYNDWHIINNNTTCVFCRYEINMENTSNANTIHILFRRFNNKLCISCLLISFTLLVSFLYIVKLCCFVLYQPRF